MPFISAADAPLFKIPGAHFIGLAAPSRGSRENALWRVTLEPKTSAHPHRLTREEIFVVIAGNATAIVGDQQYELHPGSALVVPPHTEFSLTNSGNDCFEAVAVLPVGGEAIVGTDPPFTPPWAA